MFKPDTSARNRLENGLRRFLDLQAGSGWRDLRRELAVAQGRLLDIGCGAQVVYLQPGAAGGVRSSSRHRHRRRQGVRFGYDVPDTHYFEGDDWGVEDGSFDTALVHRGSGAYSRPGCLSWPRLALALQSLADLLVLTVPFCGALAFHSL